MRSPNLNTVFYCRCGLTIDFYNGSLYVIFILIVHIVAGSPLWLQFHIAPTLSNLHLLSPRYIFPLEFLAKPYYAFRKVLFHSLARCEDIYTYFGWITSATFPTTELIYLNLPVMCDTLVLSVLFWKSLVSSANLIMLLATPSSKSSI